jgi:hypothetical protein
MGPLIYVTGVVVTVTTIMIANKIWFMAVIMGLLIAFITHMYLTTWYKVDDQKLEIKCGLLYNLHLDIGSIKKIVEMKNPISSPALSLDRLEIVYDKNNSVLVSPANKLDFITHLLRMNPDITVRLKEHNK